MANRITLIQGNTLDNTFTCLDSDGNAVDLTGATVVMNVYNESSLIETKSVTSHTDPTNGITVISFTSANTSDWPLTLLDYEIEVTLSSGKIFTAINDYIEVRL